MGMTKEQLAGFIKEVAGDIWKQQYEEAREEAAKALHNPLFATAKNDAPTSPKIDGLEKGVMAARLIRAIAAGKGDVERAAAFARKQWGDETISKALSASDGASGGFLVPEVYSAEIIEYLRPMSVVRRLNPVIMPMNQGSMTVPKLTGGAAATYIGENSNIGKTEQTLGQVVMTWHKLAALVPISNDLLRFNVIAADTMVRDDLVAAIAQRSDLAFIRDDGSQNAPKGLRYWAGNTVAANGTINLANVTSDLGQLLLKLVNNNVRMIRPAWMFAPRTWNYLMTLRDANGNFAFRDEMSQGRLWGFPFGMTTQIPTNLGGGSDESEIYLCDFADVVIGESSQLAIDASTEAAYYDGSNVVAAFSLDQTIIRAIIHHDISVRHAESVAVMTAVKWS